MTLRSRRWHPGRLLVGAAFAAAATGAGATDVAPPAPPTLLLISIDGFRWDYLDRAPNLRRLGEEGVAAHSLVPVFPSITFPNHYTIVTGLYPERHGIVDNTMIDPKLGRFTLGNRNAVSDGRWWGGEPIWVTAQRQGLRSATCFWPGSEAEIAGVRPTYWLPFDPAFKGEDRVAKVLEWLDLPPAERPALLTLYWSDVDSAGHRSGPDSADTGAAIERVDRWVGLLLDGLAQRGLTDRVDVVVVSDHGMAATPADHTLYLDQYVDLEGIEISGGTPLLLLRPPAERVADVRRALSRAHPALTVWRRERTPARWHYRDNPRIPPLLVAAAEGWNVRARRESERAGASSSPPPLGMHGYDPRLPSMQGILLARGPGLATGTRVGSVENIHLYELMCRLLGIEPAANQGRLAAVKKLLAPTRVEALTAAARATTSR